MAKYSIEIFNTANTTRLAFVPWSVLIDGTITKELNGEDFVEFDIDRRADIWQHILMRRMIRIVDTSLVPVTSRSFRISSIEEQRTSGNQVIASVRAEHIKYDLAAQIHAAAEEIIQQSPTTHLTKILTGSGFTVGTVTPTANVTIPYQYNTRLFDLDQLRASTDYDLRVNENKSVDLVAVGSTTGARIRYRRNLVSIRRTLDPIVGNVMYGTGGEGEAKQIMTISEATHRVTVVSSNDITLDSAKVVSSTGSLNNFYVQRPDNSLTQITASVKQVGANDKLTVADATGIAVGNTIKIRTANSVTARLEYIPDKASRDTYGDVEAVFKDESFREAQNLVGPFASSALSGTYTSGLCEGWVEVGDPVTTENTNVAFIKYGTKSQKVAVAAIPAPSNAPTAATSGFGLLTGTYRYKKTWRSTDGETTASPATGDVTPIAQTIDVGRNESVPSHIVSWRIYRTKSGGSTYYFVADVPSGTSTYNDNKMDVELTIVEPVDNKAAGGQGVERFFSSLTGSEYSAVVWVFVEAGGRIRAELRTGGNIFPPEELSTLSRATPVRSITTQWIITIQGFVSTGTSGSIRIVAHEGAATFYVDAAEVFKSAYPPVEGVFIADNSSTELWYKTYDFLQDSKDPKLTYDVDGLDLFEYDKAGHSADEINVGDTIKVRDEDLGIDASLRTVKKTQAILEPWKSRFEFTNAPNRLTDLIEQTRKRSELTNRAVANKAIRMFQQTVLERGTAKRPTIEIIELI
jgi:hypothetical protein